MIRVGLTGNIGSGKSIVSKIFSLLGVPVFHADEESKNFLSREDVIRKIAATFGKGILRSEHEIDRKSLASVVFSDPEALDQLNVILHPLVISEFRHWCSLHTNHPYVIMEAAIIFESGIGKEFEKIIHVSCPEETAIQRVSIRDGIPGEDVRKRMKFQLPDEIKSGQSDWVILNDGIRPVIPQVLEIHSAINEGIKT